MIFLLLCIPCTSRGSPIGEKKRTYYKGKKIEFSFMINVNHSILFLGRILLPEFDKYAL